METNEGMNLKIIDAVSKLIFYESSLKAQYHPIDIEYVGNNKELLQKVDIKDLVVHFFNNFPELFIHRFLLCILEELILFTEKEWSEIIKAVKDGLPLKNLHTFLIIFLEIDFISSSQNETKGLSSLMAIDEEDIEFITKNQLQIRINSLQAKMLKMAIFQKINGDTVS